MPYQQDCSVLSLRALNEKAYELILEAPDIVAAAQPGQFVHVSCGEGHLLRRPISICEASGMQLRLVFEVRGEGTEWLSRRTKGERVSVLGPLGHGFDVAGKRVLFIGGGIGVPPLLVGGQARWKRRCSAGLCCGKPGHFDGGFCQSVRRGRPGYRRWEPGP